MRVDQAGQEVAALQVDPPDAFHRFRRTLGNRRNPAAADADCYAGPRFGPGAVHERCVDEVEVLGLDGERGHQEEAYGRGSKEHARGSPGGCGSADYAVSLKAWGA